MYEFLSVFQIILLGQIPRSSITGSKAIGFLRFFHLSARLLFWLQSPYPLLWPAGVRAPRCIQAALSGACFDPSTHTLGRKGNRHLSEAWGLGRALISLTPRWWLQEGSLAFHSPPCPLPLCLASSPFIWGSEEVLCAPCSFKDPWNSRRQGLGEVSVILG